MFWLDDELGSEVFLDGWSSLSTLNSYTHMLLADIQYTVLVCNPFITRHDATTQVSPVYI